MNELEIMKNPNIYVNKEIIIYGAGDMCNALLNYIDGMNIRILCICDKNEVLWGKKKNGIVIVSPEKLCLLDSVYPIIIASAYYTEIIRDLEKLGIKDNVYTDFALRYSIYFNLNKGFFNEEYEKKVMEMITLQRIETELRTNYVCTHDYYVKFWGEIIKENPIIIYQPGKVGSKSLLHSIKKYGRAVIQPHVLAFRDEYMDENFFKLYKLFKDKISSYKNVKIITLVRDPVERDIAHLFEHINIKYLKLYEDFNEDLCQSIVKTLNKYIVDADMLDEWENYSPYMIHHLIRFSGKEGALLEWFEHELKQVFGIDIFEGDFDREKGYGIIKKENISVLAIKLEKLNELNDVIGDFLDIEEFELDIYNSAKNKSYYYAYKQVLRNIQLPKEYLKICYENKKLEFFYTEKEIEEMKNKWNITI